MVIAQRRAEEREEARDALIEREVERMADEVLDVFYGPDAAAAISTYQDVASRGEVVSSALECDPELAEQVLLALVACATHKDEAPQLAIGAIQALAYAHALLHVGLIAEQGGYEN